MKTLLTLLLLTNLSVGYSQCDICKEFSKEGVKVVQCNPLPVASDKLMMMGMSVGQVNGAKHIAFAIRFANEAMEVKENASIFLKNGEIIELDFSKSRLSYVGNSNLSETLFKVNEAQEKAFMESEITSVHFTLTDGIARVLHVVLNANVLMVNFKCLKK